MKKWIFALLIGVLSFNTAFAKEWALCFDRDITDGVVYTGEIRFKDAGKVAYKEPCVTFQQDDEFKAELAALEKSQDQDQLRQLAAAVLIKNLIDDIKSKNKK